jgi:hypothetical protein
MAASDQLIYNTTALTATITMSSLVTATAATANLWQGNLIDFGVTRAEQWLARLAVSFIAAPTAGGTLDLYMAWSSSSATLVGTNFPGGCTGVDSVVASPSAIPAEAIAQLDFVGSLVACATGSIVQQIQNIGIAVARARYGVPVILMRTSQVLSSASASHTLTFLPIIPQSQ